MSDETKKAAMFYQCDAGHHWLQNVGFGPGSWSAPKTECPWCVIERLEARLAEIEGGGA